MNIARRACVTRIVAVWAVVVSTAALADAPPIDQAAIDETPIDQWDRDHWSFLPVQRPTVPPVENEGWCTTAIDRFILSEWESRNIPVMPAASKRAQLRRVCLDLTGLPPSPDQIDRFVRDQKSDAYQRLVDRLLSSPLYGERWGQHWLDLARFADTEGYEQDKLRPSAWKYRDWVIGSLRRDLPYDEFVTLQIAGDLVRRSDPDARLATAFCLSGPDMSDINSQVERKHVLLNEVASTVGEVFLSLQMKCAECHDHKYDPISQADFYRLRAFFESSVALKFHRPVEVMDAYADPDAESFLFLRGDWREPGPSVTAAFPRIADRSEGIAVPKENGRRRLALASWLTDRTNPLTARSIVNRVWQFHFGQGLSTTPSDFGVMGDPPSHPELLDYLADDLMRNGWSLQRLHRMIVMSSVFQICGQEPKEPRLSDAWRRSMKIDPDNRWLSRFPRRRLDAETIRDAMLAASDMLNLAAGGPGVQPPLPEELVKTLKKGQWNVSPDRRDHYRKSIYLFARRNLRYPMFASFDRPAANCSCAVRPQSTTAVQSLMLLNSQITLEAAESLAELVSSKSLDLETRIREAYRRVYSRAPIQEELDLTDQFITQQVQMLKSEDHASPEVAALADLCRALFNSNEFLYVD